MRHPSKCLQRNRREPPKIQALGKTKETVNINKNSKRKTIIEALYALVEALQLFSYNLKISPWVDLGISGETGLDMDPISKKLNFCKIISFIRLTKMKGHIRSEPHGTQQAPPLQDIRHVVYSSQPRIRLPVHSHNEIEVSLSDQSLL